jgi:hypothetical protein
MSDERSAFQLVSDQPKNIKRKEIVPNVGVLVLK